MKCSVLAALPLIAVGSFALSAQAESVPFSFDGPGVSGSGTLTYTPDSSGAGPITDITGIFSDTNTATPIQATITGLYAVNPITPLPAGITAPDFSRFATQNVPPAEPGGAPGTSLSYDNTFYRDGAPVVCTDYPFSGGFVDVYGVLFTLSSGQVAGLWSNGVQPQVGLNYGVAVADANNTYDYVNGVNATAGVRAVPLPAAAWMGMSTLMGLAALSLVRKRRAQMA
jgi:hypothetical protein